MDLASVYVTCPDRDTARRIARVLIERRLVACANLLPIESLYRWEGRVMEEAEVAMLLKTRRERVPDVARAVAELHPHQVPCVVGLEIGDAHEAYRAWVERETAGAPQA